jgi:vacuolar protein sorting-associated protein 72
MCLLTGRPAKYRHPVSLIPYATAEAYRLIDQTLRHDFLWSEDRMAFLGTTLETDEPLEKADGMDGIEEWDDAARGWWTFLTPEVQQDHQAHQEDISMQEAAPTPSEEAAESGSKQRSTKKSSKPTKGSRPRKADVR